MKKTKKLKDVIRVRRWGELLYDLLTPEEYRNQDPEQYAEAYLFREYDPETGTGLNYADRRVKVIDD